MYCVVWNRLAACWLYQTWKFWLFACSQCFNVFARWHQRLWFKRWGLGDKVGIGVESCKIVLLGALPIYLFTHICYRLATMHSVKDQTDGQTDDRVGIGG